MDIMHFIRKKGHGCPGKITYADIDEERYEYERQSYRAFIFAAQNDILNADEEYIDLYIDLLAQEIKYSSLLEITRDNAQNRFIFPFHKMDPRLTGYKQGKEKIEIDIGKDHLISQPWKHSSYKKMLKEIKEKGFISYPDNHRAIYYNGLDVTCAYNGFHSLAIATYMGKGKVLADYYDVEKIFDYVDVNDDLSFSYNKENILKRQNNGYHGGNNYGELQNDELQRELDKRFYGTDYRLLLIYYLCQEKFKKQKNEPQRNF